MAKKDVKIEKSAESGDEEADVAEAAVEKEGLELSDEVWDSVEPLQESIEKPDSAYIFKMECPICKQQREMPVKEFYEKVTKEGPIRCLVCRAMPEFQITNYNSQAIMMAGFRHEQRRKGISDAEMQKMVGTAAPVLKRIKGRDQEVEKNG